MTIQAQIHTLINFQLNNKENLVLSACWKCLVDLPRKTLSVVYKDIPVDVGRGFLTELTP